MLITSYDTVVRRSFRRVTAAALIVLAFLPGCGSSQIGGACDPAFVEFESIPTTAQGQDCTMTLEHGQWQASYSLPADPAFVPPSGKGPLTPPAAINDQPAAACAAIDGPPL